MNRTGKMQLVLTTWLKGTPTGETQRNWISLLTSLGFGIRFQITLMEVVS